MILLDLCNVPKEMSLDDFLECCLYTDEKAVMWYKFDTKEKSFYEYPMNGTTHNKERKYINREESDSLCLLYAPVPSKHIKIK